MAASMPALDKAPAIIGLMGGSVPLSMPNFITKGILRLIGRSAASLPLTIIKHTAEVVYIQTKTIPMVEIDELDYSSSTTSAPDSAALTQPFLSFAHPAFAIFCAVLLITATAFVQRAHINARGITSVAEQTSTDAMLQGILEIECSALAKERDALTNDCAGKEATISVLVLKATEQVDEIATATTVAAVAKETLESVQNESRRVADEVKLREDTAQKVSDKQQKKIAALEAEIKKLKNMEVELGGLRKQKSALTDKVTSLETAATTSRQENEKKQADLKADLESLRKENVSLKADIRKKDDEDETLRTAQQTVKEENAALFSKLEAEHLTKGQEQLAIIKAATSKTAVLEKKLKEAGDSWRKLESEVKKAQEATKASHDTLEKSNKALGSTNTVLESRTEALIAENESLGAENERLSSTNQSLTIDNIILVEEKAETESALAKLNATNESLFSEQDDLRSANESLTNDNACVAEEKAEVESTKAEWDANFQRLVSAHNVLMTTSEQLKNEYDRALQEKAEAESALKTLKVECDDIKRSRSDLCNRNVRITKEKSGLETALKTLQGTHDTLAAAHSQTLSRYSIMKDGNVELQSRAEHLWAQIEELKSEIGEQEEGEEDGETDSSSSNIPPPPPPPDSGRLEYNYSKHDDVPDSSNVNSGNDNTTGRNGDEEVSDEEGNLGEHEEEHGEGNQEQEEEEEEGKSSYGNGVASNGNSGATDGECLRIKRPKQRGRKRRDRERKNPGLSRPSRQNAASAKTIPTTAAESMLSHPIPTGPAQRILSASATPFTTGTMRIPTGPASQMSSRTSRPIPTGPAHSPISWPAQTIPIRPTSFTCTTPARPIPTGPAAFTSSEPARSIPSGPASFMSSRTAQPIPTGPAIPSTGAARSTPTRRSKPFHTGPTSSTYNGPAKQVETLGNSIWASPAGVPPSSDGWR